MKKRQKSNQLREEVIVKVQLEFIDWVVKKMKVNFSLSHFWSGFTQGLIASLERVQWTSNNIIYINIKYKCIYDQMKYQKKANLKKELIAS